MDNRNPNVNAMDEIIKKYKEDIINFGAYGYDTATMANILNIEAKKVQAQMNKKNSEFYKLYLKGQDMSNYTIDTKLFELSKKGDLKALELFEMRKRQRTKPGK